MSPMTLLASGQFTARIVREYSAGPVEDLGVRHNEVRLYACGLATGGGAVFAVEWDAGDLDTVSIGIWTAPRTKRIVDYDGVFSLPLEIRAFLAEQGFDLSEVSE